MLDQWDEELMDWKISRSLVRESLDQLVEDEWINRLINVWIRECMDQWVGKSMYHWVSESLDQWVENQ